MESQKLQQPKLVLCAEWQRWREERGRWLERGDRKEKQHVGEEIVAMSSQGIIYCHKMRLYRVNWIYLTNNKQMIIFNILYFRGFLLWNFWRIVFICLRYDDGCILVISVIEQNWLIKTRAEKDTHVLFQPPSVSVFFSTSQFKPLVLWNNGSSFFLPECSLTWLQQKYKTTPTTLTVPEKKLCPWSDLLTFRCLWSDNWHLCGNCSVDELRSHGNCDKPNSQALCMWEREGAYDLQWGTGNPGDIFTLTPTFEDTSLRRRYPGSRMCLSQLGENTACFKQTPVTLTRILLRKFFRLEKTH